MGAEIGELILMAYLINFLFLMVIHVLEDENDEVCILQDGNLILYELGKNYSRM